MYKLLFFTALFCSFLFAEQDIITSNTNSPDYNYSLGLKYFNGVDGETNVSLAFNLFLKAADEGQINAQMKLAKCYRNGMGTETNYNKAIKWCLKAAKEGNSVAQFQIGWAYNIGEGVETNISEAIEWYKKAASQNSVRAQYNLGSLYLEGEIVTQNYNLAFNYFTVAATQNFAGAENSLGYMYRNGLGVQTNLEKAIEWYEKAAAQNNAAAQANLGLAYKFGTVVEKNLATSLFYFALSASNGCALSQFELGWRYQDGIGVTQDYKKAVGWYELAIKNGNTDALCNLAVLYEDGLGVSNDNIQAFMLYSDSAENDNAFAQERIARMYYFGNGTMKNYNKAFEWYKKAAGNGILVAQSSLGYLYKHGIGTQTNYNEAFKWYYTSATQGQSIAQFNLGVLYQEGKGTCKNLTNAFKFFLESANSGNKNSQQKIGWSKNNKNLMEFTILTNLYYLFANQKNSDAQYSLGLIYEDGTILPENNEKALKWYLKAAGNGDTAAFYRVAIIYDKQKNEKAFNWFIKSAENGNYYADFKLGYMFSEGKYTAKNFDKALKHFQKVIDSKASEKLKGPVCLMIGGIQLKQGKTAEGFATLKEAIKYPSIKKTLIVLTVIGILGGVVFVTAIFLTLFFILKNNKSFSEKKSWSIVEAIVVIGAFLFLQIGMSAMVVVPFFDKICKDIFLKLIFWIFIGNSIVIFIAILLAKIRKISVWKQFGFFKINFKKWLMIIVGGWISIIVIGIVYEWTLKIFGIKLKGQMINQELQKYDDAGSIIFLILIIGFVMPVIEELIFRGVLFQALRSKMSAFWSILISSIVFAGVHVDIKYFIPLLAMGVVSAYSFEKTKSIYTPIGIHILNNLFAVSAMFFFSN